jgi:hypothetical protein
LKGQLKNIVIKIKLQLISWPYFLNPICLKIYILNKLSFFEVFGLTLERKYVINYFHPISYFEWKCCIWNIKGFNPTILYFKWKIPYFKYKLPYFKFKISYKQGIIPQNRSIKNNHCLIISETLSVHDIVVA